jgi:uncharacterized membrane protein YqjE
VFEERKGSRLLVAFWSTQGYEVTELGVIQLLVFGTAFGCLNVIFCGITVFYTLGLLVHVWTVGKGLDSLDGCC